MTKITENTIEEFAIELLERLGYQYIYAPDIAPEFPSDGGVPEGRGGYEDVKGFCKSATIEEVAKIDYVLTPGRYVGLADEEDDFDFNERFTSLKTEFEEQLKEEAVLNKRIAENLAKIELKDE